FHIDIGREAGRVGAGHHLNLFDGVCGGGHYAASRMRFIISASVMRSNARRTAVFTMSQRPLMAQALSRAQGSSPPSTQAVRLTRPSMTETMSKMVMAAAGLAMA